MSLGKFELEHKVTLGDIVLVLTLLGGLFVGYIELHDDQRDARAWRDMHEKDVLRLEDKVDANGRILQGVLETQREVVGVMQQFPPLSP